MTHLDAARATIECVTFQPPRDYRMLMREVEKLAAIFERTSPAQHDEMLAKIHDLAGRLPSAGDSDFGALVLESTADSLANRDLARRLYQHALYRAKWYAQGATSGGEGMARSVDVRRIEAKLSPYST